MSATALATAASPPDGARDFDFLFGRWRVHNRRLRERLAGCDLWDVFRAEAECRPVLGGRGNLEQLSSDWNGGFRGLALRLFDPATRRWSIHWADDRHGTLDAPVVGGFEAGVGVFVGPELHRGATVLSRYRWSEISADGATWDQAWSTDDGASWEANWVMRFERIGA
jgi:hypothetical protein